MFLVLSLEFKRMKITLLFVGKTKDSWIQEGMDEFLKRLQKFAQVDVQIISECSKGDVQKIKNEEGKSLLEKVKVNDFVCLLDVQGELLSSEQFAVKLDTWKSRGEKLVFIVGGAFGVHEEIKKRANFLLSFSKMTFTHQMVRVFLLEQIYRGFSILQGSEYHK